MPHVTPATFACSLIISFECTASLHFSTDLVYKCLSPAAADVGSFVAHRRGRAVPEQVRGLRVQLAASTLMLGQTINSGIYTFYFLVDRLIGTMLPIWTALYFLGPSLKACRPRALYPAHITPSPSGCVGEPSALGFDRPSVIGLVHSCAELPGVPL